MIVLFRPTASRLWLAGLLPLLLAACAAPAPRAAPAPAASAPAASAPAASAPAASAAAAAPSSAARAEPTAAAAPAGAPDQVRVMVVGTAAESAIYIAMERGYFRDERIEVETLTFDSASKVMPALGTGELDVAAGAPGPALFNAVERGVGVRIVSPQSQNSGNNSSLWIIVRKELVDSGAVRTAADLQGRKVAVPAAASANEYVVDRLLQEVGLRSTDVELVELGLPDMGPALANGSIDAGLGAEPTASVFAQNGWAVKWRAASSFVPDIQFTVLLYSPKFADERTDVAARWLTAYLRGARDWQAMLDSGAGRDEIFGYLSKYTALKDRALFDRISLPILPADGRVDLQNLRDQVAWSRERGFVAQDPPLDRMVDTRFAEVARQRLDAAAR